MDHMVNSDLIVKVSVETDKCKKSQNNSYVHLN